jgi:hypothetical protein
MVRNFPVVDRSDFVQDRKKLPPVTGLDRIKPCDAIRNIFHKPANDLFSCHFLKAEGTGCDTEPVRAVGAIRECTSGTDDGECTISTDPVHHPDDAKLLRYNLHVRLVCQFPFAAAAGSDTRIQKRPEFRINAGTNREYLLPDHVRIKGCAEMVRELFADGIPVGFRVRLMPFIVIPHRTGMAADKIGDGDRGMHAMYLMEWLGTDWIILIAQCDAAIPESLQDETADQYFIWMKT